ncbi:hypothetical protein DH2020_002764 [Rehmannia glutinosa]|uniref:R13L1/DRL21-like LRR repeat region domain-containing protein n=1 Tax=Rehmannia glutinosa TaxID=99300 RepID=A0ABR0XV03_REHGL
MAEAFLQVVLDNLSSKWNSYSSDSLCSLWNLKILDLYRCQRLVALPKSMRYLKSLRHLCLENCMSLSEMPSKFSELTNLRTLSLFIVGQNRGNQLEELQRLNLGGKLEIHHLERVKNPMDAKKANIGKKKDLRYLSLIWEGNNGSRLMEDVDEKVLEELEPHPNVETLQIIGFNGRCFPSWRTNSTLKKVVEISIKGCQNCLRLPHLRELPQLKILRLANLGIEYIVEDDVQGGDVVSVDFPSLEQLNLYDLPNLRGFFKDQVMREVFPNLLDLRIERCPCFKFPPLLSFKMMHTLRCTSSALASVSKLVTLTFLEVKIDKNMTCIPIETLKSLTNLKKLEIDQTDEVCVRPEDGWLQYLNALETLYIVGWSELVELPEEIKHLKSLTRVGFYELPKMVCLPNALQHVSSLQNLVLSNLPQLDS